MLDIGLLQRLCQVPADIEITHENLLSIYRGKLAEQKIRFLPLYATPEIGDRSQIAFA